MAALYCKKAKSLVDVAEHFNYQPFCALVSVKDYGESRLEFKIWLHNLVDLSFGTARSMKVWHSCVCESIADFVM